MTSTSPIRRSDHPVTLITTIIRSLRVAYTHKPWLELPPDLDRVLSRLAVLRSPPFAYVQQQDKRNAYVASVEMGLLPMQDDINSMAATLRTTHEGGLPAYHYVRETLVESWMQAGFEGPISLKSFLNLLDARVTNFGLWSTVSCNLYTNIYWESALTVIWTLLRLYSDRLFSIRRSESSAVHIAESLLSTIDDLRSMPKQLRDYRSEMLDKLSEAQNSITSAVLQLIHAWKRSSKPVEALPRMRVTIAKP